ncbi:MAG: ATP-binding cassette domain-containing protein [Verrucomicrobiales bacterium]|nr:ATP-binding cassette domain-containing protein [Verrucomicrobiales bacterium]
MLELKDIYFSIEKNDEEVHLIDDASLKINPGHFMAIVGPSGCGKTTLLKLIAGLNVESKGNLYWNGRDLSEEGDLEPSEIGYVPQFSIAYELLTVEESVRSAIRLRVRGQGRAAFHDLLEKVLEDTGLTAIRGRPVRVLSGGQRRRLSLALELVTNPVLLLCDEVTSGLDPKSEQEVVKLLHQLSRDAGRIVINVTHSLANLDLYDSVLVLHEGKVVYHGQPRALEHYFSVTIAEDIYPRLAKRESSDWAQSWKKHRANYYEALDSAAQAVPQTAAVPQDGTITLSSAMPGFFVQFMTLLIRRWKLFLRDGGQLFLQIAILIGFPVLVVIFALDGIEPIKSLSESIAANPIEEANQQAEIFKNHLKTGGLISGLIMFQVILLTLMASNNSAREIAGERQIYEKERFGGLNPLSYLASKVAFLGFLVLVQSVWMAIFVQNICHLPTEDFGMHLALLLAVNAAMTAICLGISAMSKTAEQSSLLSVYLVGFQLPLSGAVLALPNYVEWITRPFISAYWAWSGGVSSLDSRTLSAVDNVVDTSLQASWLCLLVLCIHFAVGMFVAYVGVKKNRCL